MRNIKKLLVAAMVATMAFSVMGCNLIAKTPEAIAKTVLAKVGSEKVTLGDVDTELKVYIDQFKSQYGDDWQTKLDESTKTSFDNARKQVLEQLVEEKIYLNKAKELNLVPSQDELDKEVADKTKQMEDYYGGADKLAQLKEQGGYTDDTFKTFMENQVIVEKVKEDLVKDVAVTDDEIKDYYDKNKDSMMNWGKAKVRHVLFRTTGNEADDKKAEEDAKKASEQIKNKEVTFDKLFDEYKDNKAKASATDASDEDKKLPISEDLGEVAHNQQGYDAQFLEGLKPLTEGQISEPVKSSFGYHIIEAKEVTASTAKEYNDELKATIKTTLENTKKSDELKSKLEEFKKALDVKTYEDKIS